MNNNHADVPTFSYSDLLTSVDESQILIECRSCSLTKSDIFSLARWINEKYYGKAKTVTNSKRALLVSEDNGEDFAAYLSCIIAGFSVVPVSPSTFKDRGASLIEDLDPKLVITRKRNSTFLGLFTHIDHLSQEEIKEFFKERSHQRASTSIPWKISLDAEAYVISTSGSTGTPKFVSITHRNVRAWQENSLPVLNLSAESRFSGTYPLFFDASAMFIFGCLRTGCTLVVAEREESLLPLTFAAKSSLTHWASVPSLLDYSFKVEKNIKEINGVRTLALGGEIVSAKVSSEFLDIFKTAEVVDLYGPSEATIFVATKRFNRAELSQYDNQISLPLEPPPYPWKLMNNEAENEGELYIAGEQAFSGYLTSKGKDTQSFLGPYLATGDAFRFDEGLLHCLGRSDNETKIRGQRVTLESLERYAEEIPEVRLAACFRSQQASRDIDIAYEGTEVDNLVFMQALGRKLPMGVRVGKVKIIERFPINQNGKIDRSEIKRILETEK
uniref:AMP-binding protein n=1 Tax=Corynebacterium casei TaxID=160386 RepID=UPI00135BBDB3|nr:AMP-binding protein [Corynebacterium casei]